MVFESLESLEAALEAILGLGHNLIVQQYVRKTGQDVRVFVVGNRAIAAVRRRMRTGRLVRTLIRGGKLEATALTAAQERAAVETTRLMGLEVAAVDLLDAKGSPKVFEVNSSPALVPMEKATGVDLADAIIARAEEIVKKGGQPALIPTGLFGLKGSPVRSKVKATEINAENGRRLSQERNR
jgi:ribosomal protein S6--L-glutamate ligase